MKEILKRLRNKGVWVSIFALIPLLAQAFGWHMPTNYDAIVNMILSILVGAGILSNPNAEILCIGGKCDIDRK